MEAASNSHKSVDWWSNVLTFNNAWLNDLLGVLIILGAVVLVAIAVYFGIKMRRRVRIKTGVSSNASKKSVSWWPYIIAFTAITFLLAWNTKPNDDVLVDGLWVALKIFGAVVLVAIAIYIIIMVRKARKKKVSGGEDVINLKNTPTEKGWWDKKDEASQRRVLYIALVVIAYVVYYVTNWVVKDENDPLYGFIVGGALVIAGYHAIWIRDSGKASWITAIVVHAMLIFLVWGLLSTDDAIKTRHAGHVILKNVSEGVAKSVSALAGIKNPFGLASPNVVITSKPSVRVPSPEEENIEIVATVYGVFKEVKIPENVLFRWSCLDNDALIAVTHKGNPSGTIYDCNEHIELNNYMRNLRIGFSPKIEGGAIRARVTITHPS